VLFTFRWCKSLWHICSCSFPLMITSGSKSHKWFFSCPRHYALGIGLSSYPLIALAIWALGFTTVITWFIRALLPFVTVDNNSDNSHKWISSHPGQYALAIGNPSVAPVGNHGVRCISVYSLFCIFFDSHKWILQPSQAMHIGDWSGFFLSDCISSWHWPYCSVVLGTNPTCNLARCW